MKIPFGLLTDSYKCGHFEQYRQLDWMRAYGEFRKPLDEQDQRIVYFGMRYLIEEYFSTPMTQTDLLVMRDFMADHDVLGAYNFPFDLFEEAINSNGGFLPVNIYSLPEGSVVYPHVPVYKVQAFDKYARLATFAETLLTMVWYGSNVATISRHIKESIKTAFDKTVDPEDHWLLGSRLHDFGFRGCTSVEQSVIGGLGHLLNFTGSDTMSAAYHGKYHWNQGKTIAKSIPATEHSVMTTWPTEYDAVVNMVNKHGHKIFATVADSYDYFKFLNEVVPRIAPMVKAKGGTWVIRPDSGDPVVCVVDGLRALARSFDTYQNTKGYTVIKNAAVIQGDGIDRLIIKEILKAVEVAGFSAQNVAFGCGGGLLQKHNRDTMSFATKVSEIGINGKAIPIMKSPTTMNSKKSLPGTHLVYYKTQNDRRVPMVELDNSSAPWTDKKISAMTPVYLGGPLDYQDTFDSYRESLEKNWTLAPKAHDPIDNSIKLLQERLINERNQGSVSTD